MTLYFVGMGLSDEQDITVRGREIIAAADVCFLEGYTSILMVSKNTLEMFHGKEFKILDREAVESGCENILLRAMTEKVVLGVVGDPFCATTHSDLYLRAVERGIDVKVIHNASIMNAVGETGLQLYHFGPTVSIPYFTEGYETSYQPMSFYDKVVKNHEQGLHTLCLLDIRVKEQTLKNLVRGNQVFEPPRYMTVAEAIEQLLAAEDYRQQGLITAESKMFAIARMGSDTMQIVAGTPVELMATDIGGPLHSLVVCGSVMHEIEDKFYQLRRSD